jgi:hypothetical protein
MQKPIIKSVSRQGYDRLGNPITFYKTIVIKPKDPEYAAAVLALAEQKSKVTLHRVNPETTK